MYDSKICTSYLVYSQIWLNLPMGSEKKQYFKVFLINVFLFGKFLHKWQQKEEEIIQV
jgi:hypothetical protein